MSHFIVRKKFKKLQVRFIFFFAGPRCFIRGYFLDSKDIFFKYFTYRFLDIMRFGFVEYKLVFDMQESFIQSRINGLAFFTTDGCEKFYSLQKWRHSFYLELF